MFVRADLRFLWMLAGLGLSGCASISAPQGGPRDTEVPKLVSSSPVNEARNVQTQTIRLTFSEPVQLKDLQKNLLITPLLADDNRYTSREERNSILLTFDKPFDPNTTYSFNFGNSVVDITESNPAAELSLSFSTGPELDTLQASGTVKDLLTGATTENLNVGLYPETDTAGVRRGRPYYLARTSKDGRFAFHNVKAGRYRIYSLADRNQNYRYDEGEKIGYLPAPITLPGTGATDSLQLVMVRPDTKRPIISGQQASPTQLRISYGEGLRQAVLTPLGSTAPAPKELNEAVELAEKGRTLVVFRTSATPVGRYLLTATDSTGNVGRDTVNVRFTEPGKGVRPQPGYTVEGNPKEISRQGQLLIQFAEPVRLVANKPFGVLLEDSTTRRPLRIPADAKLSADRMTLAVTPNTKAKKTTTLLLDSTVIGSVTGRSLGFRPLRLRVTEQSATGSVAGTIQTPFKRYEVQVLDERFQVLQVLDSPKGTFRFDYLKPGSYKLRVLVDANANGTWEGADAELLRPAEPVYLYTQPIQVRANWEIEDLKLIF